MIPDFYDGYFLPDGDHDATWVDVQRRFGAGTTRSRLCEHMSKLILLARGCDFKEVYLFGSFISGKPDPGDIDLLWVYRADKYDSLSESCRELLNYATMKSRLGWDLWCCSDDPAVVSDLLSGWRKNKTKDKARGIIRIDLGKFEGLVL